MSPRRRKRGRKAEATVEARTAKATSVTSFSKRLPLALSEAALFFFRHLPRYGRGGPCGVGDEKRHRNHALNNSIHDAYLRALARLPFNAPDGAPFMPSLIPALLAGGHCFGPLPDLASNIIVNSVWIHAASAPDRFTADATDVDIVVLDDIKRASFAGLTRASHPRPTDEDHHDGTSDRDYYYAAAVAAKHPNRDAFAQFVRSGVATSPAVMELLGGTFRLSTEDVCCLSALLVAPSTPPLHPPPPRRECKFKAELEDQMRYYKEWTHELAAMAMRHWTNVVGGPELQLHVVRATTDIIVSKHCYQHINFMATPKGNPATIQLYFVEYADHLGVVLCCPVQDSVAQSGHCSVCEGRRERIIHPASGVYMWRTPFDATYDIVDFGVADLLDIKYAPSLWEFEDKATTISYSFDGDSDTEWDPRVIR